MSRTVSRVLTGVSIFALVVAAPTSAFATTHGHAHRAKPKSHSKPVKPVRFTLVGVVSSSDTATATVAVTVKSGHPKEHRTKTVTVKVPASAKVVRNGAKADLSKLQQGDHVVVIGTIVGPDLLASHVNAAGRPPVNVTPPDTTTATVAT